MVDRYLCAVQHRHVPEILDLVEHILGASNTDTVFLGRLGIVEGERDGVHLLRRDLHPCCDVSNVPHDDRVRVKRRCLRTWIPSDFPQMLEPAWSMRTAWSS